MMDASDSTVIWLVLLSQAIGMTSVGLARLSERSSHALESAAQVFFLLSLLAVGVTTLVTLSSGSGAWLITGATLPIMVVGATIDLRSQSGAEAM